MFDFLPAEAPVALQGAPLVQVIAQVKFDSQSSLTHAQGANLFKDRLADHYPRLLPEQQQTVTAGPGGVRSTSTPQWRLTDLSKSWSCVIGPEQLALETTTYGLWVDMRQRLEEALSVLENAAQPRVRERIGLRYINHVEPDADGSFDDRISTDLLGPLVRPGWREQRTTSLGQTVMREGTTQLALRYGTGVGVVDPNDRFVVDIDCFDETPEEYQTEKILSYFDSLNDSVYRCFITCLSKEFRATLH